MTEVFEILIIVLAGLVVGAVLNRVRGSKIRGGAWIAAAGLAAATFLDTHAYIAALAALVGYIAGESFGWTAWLYGLKRDMTQAKFNELLPQFDDTGRLDGSWWFASLCADPRQDFRKFSTLGMMWRGFVWWMPVFVMLWWFGAVEWWKAIPAVAGLGIVMPFAYRIGDALSLGRFRYLQKSETLYGAVYGGVIAAAMFA